MPIFGTLITDLVWSYLSLYSNIMLHFFENSKEEMIKFDVRLILILSNDGYIFFCDFDIMH